MNRFAHVLEAYQRFDPSGWVGVYRFLPVWAGLLLVALGVVLLIFGGGNWFRLVAGPMAALAGLFWGPVVALRLGVAAVTPTISMAVAGVLGLGGFLFPPLAVFLAVGLPVGLFAGQLAGPSDWFLGFVPAFLVAGMFASLLHRHVGAIVASIVGAWLLVIGMLSALYLVGGVVEAVTAQPWGVIVAAALFALAGSIYQLAARPPPEEHEQRIMEEHRERQRLKEKKALEERWSNYSSNRDK